MSHKINIKKLRFLIIKTTKLKKGMILLILQRLQFIIGSKELVIQFLSNKLNTRPYNRLDKEVVDFIECKEEPVVPHTTKCFHHQNGENTDNNENCKTHTQHQKWNKHCKTITYSLTYI